MSRPTVAITMGDASGIGPEIIMKALALPEVAALCRPLVVGDAERLREAGVPVELAREGDLIHAFINITAVSRSAYDATLRAAVALRRGIVGPE